MVNGHISRVPRHLSLACRAVALCEGGSVIRMRRMSKVQFIRTAVAAAGVAYARTDVRRPEDLTSVVNLACDR